MGQDRGEMFGGSSGSDTMAHIHLLDLGNALERTGCPMVHLALVFQVLVEQLVQTTVRGFLTNETFEFIGKLNLLLRAEFFLGAAQAVDEELLTHGKAHGQGIHEGRGEGITAIPAHRNGGL